MAKAENATETTTVAWKHPLVLVGAGAVVLALVVGLALHHERAVRAWARPGLEGPRAGVMSSLGDRHGQLSGGFNRNESRLEGVVTAVNGDTLTLAGGGKTNAVKTSSSTQYSGGSSAVVNDTVIVAGTINNGTFEATQILVNP